MRRALTALIIVLPCAAYPLAQKDHALTVQGEYRRDAIDYEESARDFHRERITLSFSRASGFTAARVSASRGDHARCTWNLRLGDLSPHVSFMAGHFFTHFGKGLLAGKRSPFEPDVFSQRGAIGDGDVFAPCRSGNPYFAFNGVAATISAGDDSLALSLHSFYSLRERFVTQEDYESRNTSSLSSIESREGRSGAYCEPVRVHTRGAMLALSALDCLHARAYALDGRAATPEGDTVTTGGLEGFTGGGFTLEYRDDCLSIFHERAMARSRYGDGSGRSSDSSGRAYLAGTSLSLPCARASFIYKNCDDGYYSPYTATMGEYIGTGIFFDVIIMPMEGLSLGASCSSERKANTGSRDDEQTVAERERVFLSYARSRLDELRSEIGISRRSDEGSGDRRRWRQRFSLRPVSFLSIGASATYQTTEGLDDSKLGTVSLGLGHRRLFTIAFSYTLARIAESNPVYESLLPMKNATIPGTFIRESGTIIAGRTTLAWHGIYASCRLVSQLCDGGRRSTMTEFFASGSW